MIKSNSNNDLNHDETNKSLTETIQLGTFSK
jgi:hypothetical protein